jgi:hypothetical protein
VDAVAVAIEDLSAVLGGRLQHESCAVRRGRYCLAAAGQETGIARPALRWGSRWESEDI